MCMYKLPASGLWFTGDLWTERGWRAWSLRALQEMTNSQFTLRTTNLPPPPNPSVTLNGVLVMALQVSIFWHLNINLKKNKKFPIDLSEGNLGWSCFLSILVAEMENLNCTSYLCSVLLLCGKCRCCVLQKCQYDLDRLWNGPIFISLL